MDIAAIILIGQEKLHIGRCLEKLAALDPRQIFVVTSQPDDGGESIARETAARLGLNLQLAHHDWPGLQSVQFNWALDKLEIESEWILRLDADEYLTDDSVRWLTDNLRNVSSSVSALVFTLERKFMGGVIRHATNGIKMVRMFRRGRGRYAEVAMDERIVFEGVASDVPVVFYDDNLNGLAWWKAKHRGYAKREAEQAIRGDFPDPRKTSYYKLPRYLRAVVYFALRYFAKGGFLDGIAGWRWNFWQGLWYRCLVDCEIGRLRKGK